VPLSSLIDFYLLESQVPDILPDVLCDADPRIIYLLY